jgi:hypothetical protein
MFLLAFAAPRLLLEPRHQLVGESTNHQRVSVGRSAVFSTNPQILEKSLYWGCNLRVLDGASIA